MKLESIEFNNFRKLRNTGVDFTDNLILLEGENNAGKSTVFYGIYYVLTGEAFNFNSPKEYISFDESRMSVELQFSVEGNNYFITSEYTESGRGTYAIGRIKGDQRQILESTDQGAKVSEVRSKVYGITGLDKKVIENVTYAAQQEFVEKVSGGPRQRESMDYIFEVKTVDELSSAIRDVLQTKENQVDRIEDLEKRREDQKETLKEYREEIKNKEEKIEERSDKLKEIGDRLEEIEEDLDDAEEVYLELKEIQEKKNAIEKQEERKQEKQERVKEIQKEYGEETDEKIDEIEDRIEQLEKELEDIEVEKDELEEQENEIDEFERELTSLEEQTDDKISRIEDIEEQLESIDDDELEHRETETIKEDIEDKEEKLQDIRDERSRMRSKLNGLEKTHNQGECDVCGREVQNPDEYHERIQKKKEHIEELDEQIEGLEEELEKLEKELDEARSKKERAEQLKDLREESEELRKEKEELDEKSDDIEKDLEELEQKFDAERLDELEELIPEKTAKIRELESQKNTVEKIGKELEKKQGEIADITETIREFREKYADHNLEKLSGKLEDAEEKRNKLSEEKARIDQEINSLENSIEDLQQDVDRKKEMVEDREENLENLDEEIEELQQLSERIDAIKENLELYSASETEIRKRKVRQLEKNVFSWYRKLAARNEFQHLRIDENDYSLKGVPVNAAREYSIADYQGGGQLTLTALAYQLGLAEMTGSTDFMMIDEPTDATDTENRESLLEMIHSAVSQFNQILLITHHGAGREKADRVIRVEKESAEESVLHIRGR